MMPLNWQEAQKWERDWWNRCTNTYGEEEKQLLYAKKMGLIPFHDGKSPYNFDLQGKSVLDIGGGPSSLLLKCTNLEQGYVIDPLIDKFPTWVKERYKNAQIIAIARKGEDIENHPSVDEVWIYNVLEHCENPNRVIENAKKVGSLIRIFEWIDTPTDKGHPHSLTEVELNHWLDGEGKVEDINTPTCKGRAYYGVFPT